ncbi:hypothetical protein D030_3463B, partial [Vibrio parahaemolyticus AQ3810]
SSCRKQEFLG